MPEALLDILAFQGGYNTSLVLLSTLLLGAGAGPVGVYILFRRRSLITDAIAHATLPGIALGFLAALLVGLDGRSLPILLAGAALTAALGALAVQWIRDKTRLAEDAAIGTVLSASFGLGIVLLSVIQNLPVGGQAGLDSFLLGQTAAMNAEEARIIGIGSAVVLALVTLGSRAFAAVSFDPEFTGSIGWSVRLIDLAMIALALAVVVVGLKTVGLVLIIALLITPAVAARLWSRHIATMALLAGIFGALSGYLGSALSASLPNLPTGGVIVLVAAAIFMVSLVASPRRGIVAAALVRRRIRRRIAMRQALAALERGESVARALRRRLQRHGLATRDGGLGAAGSAMLQRWRRDERLWHRYIVEHGTPPLDAYWSPPETILLPGVVAALEAAEAER
ncbi:MAG: metal ABC transporter permease [Azospirillaceae bacterium]